MRPTVALGRGVSARVTVTDMSASSFGSEHFPYSCTAVFRRQRQSPLPRPLLEPKTTASLARETAPMALRFLITGATGFIGGHLAEACAARGHAVRTVVRPGSDAARLEQLGVA